MGNICRGGGGQTHHCTLEKKRHANLMLVLSKLLLRFEHGWDAISSRHNIEVLWLLQMKNKAAAIILKWISERKKKNSQIPFVHLMWELFWAGCYTTYPDPTAVLSTSEMRQNTAAFSTYNLLSSNRELCVRPFIYVFCSQLQLNKRNVFICFSYEHILIKRCLQFSFAALFSYFRTSHWLLWRTGRS